MLITSVRKVLFIAIVFAAGVASADVIVRKEGCRITGRLNTCDEERCFVGGQRSPTDEIARIELVDAPVIPPAATAGSIVFRDGSIGRGPSNSNPQRRNPGKTS